MNKEHMLIIFNLFARWSMVTGPKINTICRSPESEDGYNRCSGNLLDKQGKDANA